MLLTHIILNRVLLDRICREFISYDTKGSILSDVTQTTATVFVLLQKVCFSLFQIQLPTILTLFLDNMKYYYSSIVIIKTLHMFLKDKILSNCFKCNKFSKRLNNTEDLR